MIAYTRRRFTGREELDLSSLRCLLTSADQSPRPRRRAAAAKSF